MSSIWFRQYLLEESRWIITNANGYYQKISEINSEEVNEGSERNVIDLERLPPMKEIVMGKLMNQMMMSAQNTPKKRNILIYPKILKKKLI